MERVGTLSLPSYQDVFAIPEDEPIKRKPDFHVVKVGLCNLAIGTD